MDATTDIDAKLGAACTACHAACCKQGMVFLTEAEHQSLTDYCTRQGDTRLEEFRQRTQRHPTHAILAQHSGCMFLDAKNQCELHAINLKPMECRWWPLHVYVDPANEQLYVGLASYCCDGLKEGDEALAYLRPHLDSMRKAAEQLREFRSIFPGSRSRQVVLRL